MKLAKVIGTHCQSAVGFRSVPSHHPLSGILEAWTRKSRLPESLLPLRCILKVHYSIREVFPRHSPRKPCCLLPFPLSPFLCALKEESQTSKLALDSENPCHKAGSGLEVHCARKKRAKFLWHRSQDCPLRCASFTLLKGVEQLSTINIVDGHTDGQIAVEQLDMILCSKHPTRNAVRWRLRRRP